MQARLSWFSLLSAGVLFSAVEGVGQQMTNVVLVFSPGWHLMSNPLLSTNNDVSNLFKDPPLLLTVNKRNPNGGPSYDSAAYDPDIPGWNAPMQIRPGEGVFLFNPGPGNYTNVFVGEIVVCSTNHMFSGCFIRSQIYPSSKLTNYSPVGFETLFLFKQGHYESYTFDPDLGGWSPAEPVIPVGEAF